MWANPTRRTPRVLVSYSRFASYDTGTHKTLESDATAFGSNVLVITIGFESRQYKNELTKNIASNAMFFYYFAATFFFFARFEPDREDFFFAAFFFPLFPTETFN